MRLLIFLFLISCGSDKEPMYYLNRVSDTVIINTEDYKNTRTVFRQYIDTFERNIGVEIPSDLRMRFTRKDLGVSAYCTLSWDGDREIVINYDEWLIFSENPEEYNLMREALIFHELGHCILGKKHNKGMKDFFSEETGTYYKAPESLMYPSISFWYIMNREYYIDKLRE